MNDMDWIGLFLLLMASNPKTLEEYNEECKREKELQQNCPSIEWWQDMNSHIPFCKLDGKLCEMQCVKKVRRTYNGERCMFK